VFLVKDNQRWEDQYKEYKVPIMAKVMKIQIVESHKGLGKKSRVKGDFHARFCGKVGVKFPRLTRL